MARRTSSQVAVQPRSQRAGLRARGPVGDLRAQRADNLRLGSGGVDAALAYFPELEKLLSRPAGLLSAGAADAQLRPCARHAAAALLADEVSLGLAPIIVDRLFGAIRQASIDSGMGVLLVEQQPRRALAIADRWYLLKNGQMVADGPATDASLLDESYLPSAPASPPEPGSTKKESHQ